MSITKSTQIIMFTRYSVYLYFLIFTSIQCHSKSIEVDVCILGGSEAGFTSAIQAARMGSKVVLIEPSGHPGGMMVEGIHKDIRFGSAVVIGGIAREIYKAIEAHYDRKARFDSIGWYARYEPKVAETIIEGFLKAELNITVIRNMRIREFGGVVKEAAQIKSIFLENHTEIKASVYIDASIEGHLIRFANVSRASIREGNGKYNETLNGIQAVNEHKQFKVNIDPFVLPGKPESGIIHTIQDEPVGISGAPSKFIQGYCYRLVLTRNPDNMIPVARPYNYEPEVYEIYRRYLKAGGRLFRPKAMIPNGKTDLGSWHDLSANLYGENWMYPEGSYRVQDSVVKYHRTFTQGLIWFLQNDPSIDEKTKAEWEGWGLCKDEFTDNHGWPRRLYIRSAIRMISDYVITEHHSSIDLPDTVTDAVAIAWWPPDMHHARRIIKNGYAYNEGFSHVGKNTNWKPYRISYRAMIPFRNECQNLITPTCLSSSYVGYAAIRIMPTFMILGQSAGAAASLVSTQNIAVQDLSYSKLNKSLSESGQILSIPPNWAELIRSD